MNLAILNLARTSIDAIPMEGRIRPMKPTSCECCLMPLSKDPGPRTSDKYCSFCFQSGKLIADGVSLREFQSCAYDGMRKRGMNALVARLFSFTIRFSPYWKNRK